jgi:hypothetical protein
MSDDEITRELVEAEDELARIEAEITGHAAVKSTSFEFRPLSIASLSLQCRSMSLMELVNTSLNTHNMPSTWAQNEARSATAVPRIVNSPIQSFRSAQHRSFSYGARPATVAPVVSNQWKRCLLTSVGISKPLAVAWGEALSSCFSADTSGLAFAVPSHVLRFLPLIDPQFEEYATLDTVLKFDFRDFQVSLCTLHQLFFTNISSSADVVCGHAYRS